MKIEETKRQKKHVAKTWEKLSLLKSPIIPSVKTNNRTCFWKCLPSSYWRFLLVLSITS